MILLDTSGLLAALNPREAQHSSAWESLNEAQPPRIMSPFVLAELDYLVLRDLGSDAERALLEDVSQGVYELAPFSAADVSRAVEIATSYKDASIGLSDASIVVLAERYASLDLLTLDYRHFRALHTRDGTHFRLLPADGKPLT